MIRMISHWNYISDNMISVVTYINDFENRFPALKNSEPWEITSNLGPLLLATMGTLGKDFSIKENIAIHRSAKIEEHSVIKGPAIICENCFVAAHTYLRGGVYLGKNTTVGPGTEIKSSLIMGLSALAHFNFVGDSLIGSSVNMEAGSIIANHWNERDDKTICILINGKAIPISKQKFGAVIGDGSRIGANAVLAPGTILLKKSIVKRLELVDQCK